MKCDCSDQRRNRMRFPLNAKHVDQCRESSGLMPATWTVQKEPGERRTPILQHANQRAAREVFRHPVLCDPRKSHAVKSSLNHKIEFIEEQ